jgi:hypothetical protein
MGFNSAFKGLTASESTRNTFVIALVKRTENNYSPTATIAVAGTILLTYRILLPSNASFSFALSRYVPTSLTFWSLIEQRDGVWRL